MCRVHACTNKILVCTASSETREFATKLSQKRQNTTSDCIKLRAKHEADNPQPTQAPPQ